jgi:hypothetical protein
MMTMKKIASILLSLSILAGIVGQATAADVSGSKEYEQPRREIRGDAALGSLSPVRRALGSSPVLEAG